ncbi:MAG: PhnD/SsuA/transferrin family substrate-binding protein, partial [Pseudomonadota bacterium]
ELDVDLLRKGSQRAARIPPIDVELSEFVEIWRSPRLPNGPIVVRGDLSPLLKAGVVGALVQLNVANPACLRNVLGDEFKRFEPISHNAYGPIIDALKFQEQRAGD